MPLAWRLRHPDTAAAWLCVTGTNGKTTTTLMLEAMLRADGEQLKSLENQLPLNDFDIVGFSLQYELSYTNILNMLDLAGLPIRASEELECDMAKKIKKIAEGEIAGFGASPVRGAGRIESGAVALRFASGLAATISFGVALLALLGIIITSGGFTGGLGGWFAIIGPLLLALFVMFLELFGGLTWLLLAGDLLVRGSVALARTKSVW